MVDGAEQQKYLSGLGKAMLTVVCLIRFPQLLTFGVMASTKQGARYGVDQNIRHVRIQIPEDFTINNPHIKFFTIGPFI